MTNTNHVLAEVSVFGGLALAALVSAPLLYAGVSKLLAPEKFLAGLHRLRLPIPSRTSSAVAIGLAECVVAVANIILSLWILALACLSLYLIFAAVLERARRAGVLGDCGCFGAIATAIDITAVARNGLFACVALVLLAVRVSGVSASYDSSVTIAMSVALLLGAAVIDTLFTLRSPTVR